MYRKYLDSPCQRKLPHNLTRNLSFPANHSIYSVGDQHQLGAVGKSVSTIAANPFEEPKTRMCEYTAKEIATLQSRLDKQLGPEYISSRPGASGQRVHY